MFKTAKILIPALLIASLSGCGMNRYQEVKDADLVEVSEDAVSELKSRLTRTIPKNSLIVVSTLLNVDNLNKTSAFGRIVSDQIASGFHEEGYQIVGMEMPIDLFVMKEDGTLQLSDETKAMLKHYRAGILVGGVYAPGKKNSYVSLRVVELSTRNIISSSDFSVPMGPDAKKLMEPKDVGSTDTPAKEGEEGASNGEISSPEQNAVGTGGQPEEEDSVSPTIKDAIKEAPKASE